MKLQFFHVEDLCKIIKKILKDHPEEHILNVGNTEVVDINTFVELCYEIVGTPLEKVYVVDHDNQRDYFSFYNYEYTLDVTKQNKLLPALLYLGICMDNTYNNEMHYVSSGYFRWIGMEYTATIFELDWNYGNYWTRQKILRIQ